MPSQVHDAEGSRRDRAREEHTYAVLIRGRECVRSVLEPHLGAPMALERANNIAQALVFTDVEPREVVLEMLRQVPFELRLQLAESVARVWLEASHSFAV